MNNNKTSPNFLIRIVYNFFFLVERYCYYQVTFLMPVILLFSKYRQNNFALNQMLLVFHVFVIFLATPTIMSSGYPCQFLGQIHSSLTESCSELYIAISIWLQFKTSTQCLLEFGRHIMRVTLCPVPSHQKEFHHLLHANSCSVDQSWHLQQ